jgi:SAM-dependent methyltransferase
MLKYLLRKSNGAVKRVILLLYKEAFPQKNSQDLKDPEMLALRPYCKGVGLDVGCGSKKTHPDAIGVDITPKGKAGKYGSENRQISEADVNLSGDDLYLFADSVFDYVVSRHNLEHYRDPVKALLEWKRVLKKGGTMGIVVPDDEKIDSIKLDPTHKHAFTQDSLKNIIKLIGGLKILKLKPCIPDQSFVCIAKKI